MTKSMDAVLERVGRLPVQRQDEIARVIEQLLDFEASGSDRLTPAHWLEIDNRLASEPKFASDDEVSAFFRAPLA